MYSLSTYLPLSCVSQTSIAFRSVEKYFISGTPEISIREKIHPIMSCVRKFIVTQLKTLHSLSVYKLSKCSLDFCVQRLKIY